MNYEINDGNFLDLAKAFDTVNYIELVTEFQYKNGKFKLVQKLFN